MSTKRSALASRLNDAVAVVRPGSVEAPAAGSSAEAPEHAASSTPAGEHVGCRHDRSDARRNHERLVTAARRVFASEGGGASMEAVAREAGVGVGTLYRHFPRRIDLVEAVYRDDVDDLVRTADQAVAELEPWSAVDTFLRAFVRYAKGKRTFLNELHEAFDKNPDLRLGSRERIEQAMAQVLARAQQAGIARTDLDGADVMQLLGPMCTSPTLSDAQGERLIVMILDGLRAPMAARSAGAATTGAAVGSKS